MLYIQKNLHDSTDVSFVQIYQPGSETYMDILTNLEADFVQSQMEQRLGRCGYAPRSRTKVM